MAIFSLIIDGAFAFNLEVVELYDGFYETLQKNPKIVECTEFDVAIGDSYINGIFYKDSVALEPVSANPGTTKFAFILGKIVSIIQELPDTEEMLVAAYSSDPTFVEIQ